MAALSFPKCRMEIVKSTHFDKEFTTPNGSTEHDPGEPEGRIVDETKDDDVPKIRSLGEYLEMFAFPGES